MSEQPPTESPDWKAQYNAQNIQNLTYEEIIALNREKNKGTFIDRTWREKALEDAVYDDPNYTKWQKFKSGAYSFSNVGRSFAKDLAFKQRKVEYIEDMLEDKNQFTEERDKLLLKKVEVKILNTFNMYRVPFMVGSFTMCMLLFFRSKKPLAMRVIPVLVLGSLSTLYNYQVGQYGVYKNIDHMLSILTEKGDTEVGQRTRKFVDELDEERYGKYRKAKEAAVVTESQ